MLAMSENGMNRFPRRALMILHRVRSSIAGGQPERGRECRVWCLSSHCTVFHAAEAVQPPTFRAMS